MSRPGVSYYEVANAIQRLVASEQEPTIERIRLILKTGSNSTIGQHLRVWRAKQDSTQQIASKEHLPEELVSLLKGLWERVMAQAESQITTIKEAATQNQTQLTEAVEQQQKENNRLLQVEAELKQSIRALTADKMTLEQLLATDKTNTASLEAQLSGLAHKLSEKELRIEELHKQNQQAQSNLEHYRTAMAEQRQADNLRHEDEQQWLAKSIERLEQENSFIKQERIELDKELSVLRQQHQSTLLQSSDYSKSREAISVELEQTKLLLAQKSENCNHWQKQYDTLSAESKEQAKEIMNFQTEIAVLAEQLSVLKVQLNEAIAQNKLLANDKWILGQEKAQLMGELKQLHHTFVEKVNI